MAEENKKAWGGKRTGSGRKKGGHNSYKSDRTKKSPELLTKKRTVTLNDEEWKVFIEEGGTKTLHKMIASGYFKKDFDTKKQTEE